MPMRGEIQIAVVRPRDRETWSETWRKTWRKTWRESWADQVWAWIVATVKNPEFLMVVLFCTVGLWLTFYFIHFFPDFGEMAEALQQIP
jgi:hypothetical protein